MKPTLVYILATSYSGSTLLTYLLANHSGVATVGELKAPNMGDVSVYRCSCGELIRECGFWQTVTEKCRAQGIDFSVDDFDTIVDGHDAFGKKVLRAKVRNPAFERLRDLTIALYPGLRKRLRSKLHRNFVLSNVICDTAGGSVFVDGTKDATRLRYFIDSGLWNVKTIYLTRDGRAVTNSIKKHLNIDIEAATARWMNTTQQLEHMRERINAEPVFDLKYETLCESPSETLNQLWQWIGLQPEAVQEKNFKSGDFHLLGNSMRLSSVGEIRKDTSWRQKLAQDEIDHFNTHAGELNAHLGYL
ncbi:MAG: sulfotransferase [Pseudomonadota bacterium]